MELAILAALCLGAGWGIVAKGEKTLRATRGSIGAARGVGRYARGKGRVAPFTSSTKKADKKGRTGSSVRPADATQPTSIREAARMGWADGVQRALDKRAAGKDIVGRTRRAAKWTGDKAGRVYTGAAGLASVVPRIRKARADSQAKLAAAKAKHATADTEDPPSDDDLPRQKLWQVLSTIFQPADISHRLSPQGEPNPDPPAPAEDTDTKEKNVPDLNIGEMPTRTDMKTATGKLAAAVEKHREAEAAIREAAAGFAERYQGADWGTKPLDTAAASVSEIGSQKELNTEALSEALASVDAAIKQDEGLAEVAASQGAYGRVESHV